MNAQKKPFSITNTDFSAAFKQLANYVAITKTRDWSSALDQLIMLCLFLFPSEKLFSSSSFLDVIRTLLLIQLPDKEVNNSIQRLRSQGKLVVLSGEQFGLSPSTANDIKTQTDSARALEEQVRSSWIDNVSKKYPTIDTGEIWKANQDYLLRVFRNHGMQAVALLDSSADIEMDQIDGLAAILESVIQEHFGNKNKKEYRDIITSFTAEVGSDRRRAEYISQCADVAFSYFSLAIAPEVSEKLRSDLKPLTLFLDTNFLFGTLDLHDNPLVEVSSELLDVVRNANLPFKLRYHEATVREMTNTLEHFRIELIKRKWPQSISRAALSSEAISGIERRYHQKNAIVAVDVEDFIAPLQHWQVVLKDKGVDIYRITSDEDRLRRRADLESDYSDFLRKIKKEKPYEAIQHDMSVLETVISLCTQSRSTLEAGAIFVTCDYSLYRFGQKISKARGQRSCIVLPSLLLQMLRPYVTSSEEFDLAFAETFALPEFVLNRGGAQKAASKMLSILAGYSGIPEETASKMLSNDILLKDLQKKRTDEDFERTVESAIAQQNTILMEEQASLSKELEREKIDKEKKERELALASQELDQRDASLQEREKEIEKRKEDIRRLEERIESQDRILKETIVAVETERREKKETESQAKSADVVAGRKEKDSPQTNKIAGIGMGILLSVLFLLTINYVIPWRWMLDHQNSYGLQGCVSFAILTGTISIWVRQWRKALFTVVGLMIVATVLTMLGGPRTPASP